MQQTHAVQPGAAGAGQPWYGKRMCGAKRKQCAKAGHRCKRQFDHGGLTPAAPANVRFCIAKDVVLPTDERRSMHQERGA
jgi:hypothetical protein